MIMRTTTKMTVLLLITVKIQQSIKQYSVDITTTVRGQDSDGEALEQTLTRNDLALLSGEEQGQRLG